MIFKLGNTDLLHDIVVGSYSANRVDVFESWDDANRVTHREVTRQRVKGTVNLYFRNNERLAAFKNTLQNKLSGGYYLMTLTLNDTDEVYSGEFYISYETVRDVIGSRDGLKEFTLSFEER